MNEVIKKIIKNVFQSSQAWNKRKYQGANWRNDSLYKEALSTHFNTKESYSCLIITSGLGS